MNIQVPFGGSKSSGIGREFGEYVSDVFMILIQTLTFTKALRAFTETKTVLIK
jgi:acyl-CoA reductase-like NAD-dependent aldehyde dehydrogenase